jgi:AbrB family looped-hinge helix DNA binding protein
MKVLKRRKKRISKKDARAACSCFRMAIISSRGQITIPQDIRDLMHIRRGSVVGFEPTRKGILMVAMKLQPKDPYTEKEWRKIEKLSRTKGKSYHSAEEAKKHIAEL